MIIIYKKGQFLIKYRDRVLLRQSCWKINKIFMYFYLIFIILKLGLIKLGN